MIGDYAFFSFVAERLLTGDRLYIDIWDNKEPFLFYILALGRLLSPLSGWFFEFLWFAVAATASYAIAWRLGLSIRRSALTAGVGIPIVMAGSYYWPGSSHTPGVALALVTIGLYQANRTLLSGLSLGALPFLKVLAFPTTAAVVAMLLILSWQWRQALRLLTGVLTAVVLTVLLLISRNEWLGFQNYLTYNSYYSSQVVSASSTYESLLEHLSRVLDARMLIALTAGASIIIVILLTRIRLYHLSDEVPKFALSIVAGSATSILTLALTAQWYHHAMVLAIPFALTLLLMAAAVPLHDGYISFGMIVVTAYLLAGAPTFDRLVTKLEFARGDISLHVTPPDIGLDEVAAPHKTFARVGGGDITGIAPLLRDWDVSCPFIAQYEWDPPERLQDTLACLENVDVIYISRREFSSTPGDSGLNDFQNSVEALLEEKFTCRNVPGGQLCNASHLSNLTIPEEYGG